MFELARKHGPFDDRYPVRLKLPSPSSDLTRDGDQGERLEWSEFLARFFPSRRRHHFAAVAAYEAYRNMFEQGTSPVPIAASAAVMIWESEGGASAERPAG